MAVIYSLTGDSPMERYENLGGDSGVAAFEHGPNYIRVRFLDGAQYLYTDTSAGPGNIEQMKRLAVFGQGLNTFINRVTRKKYARQER